MIRYQNLNEFLVAELEEIQQAENQGEAREVPPAGGGRRVQIEHQRKKRL